MTDDTFYWVLSPATEKRNRPRRRLIVIDHYYMPIIMNDDARKMRNT